MSAIITRNGIDPAKLSQEFASGAISSEEISEQIYEAYISSFGVDPDSTKKKDTKRIKEIRERFTDKVSAATEAITSYRSTKQELIQGAEDIRSGYISHLESQSYPIQKYTPTSEQSNQEYVTGNYPDGASGVGVVAGSYAIYDSRNGDSEVDFFATSNLIDCNCLTLFAQNPENLDEKITILAHIDVVTNFETEIDKLLDLIPEGYNIQSGLYTSSIGDNPLTQTEVTYQLAQSGRVSSIEYNHTDVVEIGIDVNNGKVMTSHLGEPRNYAIENLPFDAEFTNTGRLDKARNLGWAALDLRKDIKERAELEEAYGPNIKNYENLLSNAIEKSESISSLEVQKFNEVTKEISERLLRDGLDEGDHELLGEIIDDLKSRMEKDNLENANNSEVINEYVQSDIFGRTSPKR